MSSILEIKNLYLKAGEKELCSDFSLSLKKGDKAVVEGSSGTGKSTLIHTILGFFPDYKGSIRFMDKELSPETVHFFRTGIAWMPQQITFRGKVLGFFEKTFDFHVNRHLRPTEKEISDYIGLFKLDKDTPDKKFEQISGGEKQRVILMVVLLLKRPLLLLDEPVSSLDEENKTVVTDVILGNPALTVLSASHDKTWNSRCTINKPF
ncbi:MAG: hypothetical protein A2W91_00950 [Bacteroidetes bacterium GWF2_38_335]|nr:MAG: hypothetical protein A2W91_00950 [Bacteroidetes bacterium GWF2_38_335]OFY80322.1 MAG: hypothetical protein A2281_17460 [Bacteroidetes bacterium RIFOXYA12_FULL_38_20]HBS88878.1 hypothetical protein [Bacteroidales bacterium]